MKESVTGPIPETKELPMGPDPTSAMAREEIQGKHRSQAPVKEQLSVKRKARRRLSSFYSAD